MAWSCCYAVIPESQEEEQVELGQVHRIRTLGFVEAALVVAIPAG